jgi:hypothetical protein
MELTGLEPVTSWVRSPQGFRVESRRLAGSLRGSYAPVAARMCADYRRLPLDSGIPGHKCLNESARSEQRPAGSEKKSVARCSSSGTAACAQAGSGFWHSSRGKSPFRPLQAEE